MIGYEHKGPFDLGFLPVDSIHQVYYEQYGPRDGLPGRSNSSNPAKLGGSSIMVHETILAADH